MPKTEPTLTAFVASLDPKARIIHRIAAERLKTRYVPERTNAWAAWTGRVAAAAAAAAAAAQNA